MQEDGPVQAQLRMTGTRKSDRKSKLWKNIMQEWNMQYVNIARCPGSATRVFTSNERLANQLKKNETDDPQVGEIGEVGKLEEKIATGGPQGRKIMKKVVTGDRKVGELVQKIQINEQKLDKSGDR